MHCIDKCRPHNHDNNIVKQKIKRYKMESKEMCRAAECIVMHCLALLQVRKMVGELLSLISL